jgi:hypothetical protein
MDHENHVIELFTGYSYLNKATKEMKANCSVTLVKGEKKIILVRLKDALKVISIVCHVAPQRLLSDFN